MRRLLSYSKRTRKANPSRLKRFGGRPCAAKLSGLLCTARGVNTLQGFALNCLLIRCGGFLYILRKPEWPSCTDDFEKNQGLGSPCAAGHLGGILCSARSVSALQGLAVHMLYDLPLCRLSWAFWPFLRR